MQLRAAILPLCLLILFSIAGCFKMKVEAPPRSGDYVLGAKDQPIATKVKKRVWYVFWGLLPVSNNSSSDVVKRLPPGYRIVKVETSADATSFIIALFTLGIVGSSVIVAEGVAPPVPPGEPDQQVIESSLPP